LFEFAAQEDGELGRGAIEAISSAVEVLRRHPHVGRPVRANLRELVISYGRTGHVALYRVRVQPGQVEVLALRHQREVGYL
jgi:plasmid stabilization system protein ParE